MKTKSETRVVSSIWQSTTKTIKSRLWRKKRDYEDYNYVYFNKFDKLYKLNFLLQQKRSEQKIHKCFSYTFVTEKIETVT